MRKSLIAALVAAAIVGCAGPPAAATAGPVVSPTRGAIVSAAHVLRLSARAVAAHLRRDTFEARFVRYGVDAYRIVYRTVTVGGRPTTASGLVVLPRNIHRRLRAVSYAHGTMAGRDEAPSVDDGGRSDEGLSFASAGFAAIEPDYLGLGVGPGAHPYLHLASEVTAQQDMLAAADTFTHSLHRVLDRGLFVTGFSQGGAAAMAFGKALQHSPTAGFHLAAVSAISGPYALRTKELPAVFGGRIDQVAATYYLAYVTTAWNRIYHLYRHASSVFRARYDRTVPRLFDGTHDDAAIVAALPDSPATLFTPSWLRRLRHPHGTLANALEVNSTACTGWRHAAVHIYAAHADEQVAIGNAYTCQQQLADDGVAGSLIDIGKVGHLESGKRGLAATIAWFQRTAGCRWRRTSLYAI